MATPTYPFNPYQDIPIARVTQQIATTTTKQEYVPRVAPFYSKNCVVKKLNDSTPLVFGKDYVFAHPFDEFIELYKRNIFGSIVLLSPYAGTLEVTCDTIGGPFILDDVAFTQYVVDILTKPREASWDDLVPDSIPTTFPTPPHDHPMTQTYDYLEMMTQLRSLVIATNTTTGGVNLAEQLKSHIEAKLPAAHASTNKDLGLGDVPNIPRAKVGDLAGNSNDVLITVSTLKEALRQMVAGELNLD